MKITESNYFCSLTNYKNYFNNSLPEIGFAGKSNVGKSSLINTLSSRNRLAYISKTPGKTVALNYFLINKKFYFVDFPGYGFAKVSIALRKEWKNLIEKYLLNSEMLKLLFILIDSRRGSAQSDLDLINFCDYFKKDFCIVLTKSDKVKRIEEKVEIIKKNISSKLKYEPVVFSSKTGQGKDELLKIIELQL